MNRTSNFPGCTQGSTQLISYTSLAQLGYRVWLVDIWGTVMLDERRLNISLLNAMRDFRRGDGLVALVTNSGRPSEVVVAELASLGGDSEIFFDVCVSGGDLGRTALAAYAPANILWLDDWLHRPKSAIDIDAVTVAVVGLRPCAAHDIADLVGLLRILATRAVPLFCLNPDLCLANDGQLEVCAGIPAGVYESFGGSVTYFGKPFPTIFHHAIEALSAVAGHPSLHLSDALVIGDTLRTDILGGIAAGADTAHVVAGGLCPTNAGSALMYPADSVSTFRLIERPD